VSSFANQSREAGDSVWDTEHVLLRGHARNGAPAPALNEQNSVALLSVRLLKYGGRDGMNDHVR